MAIASRQVQSVDDWLDLCRSRRDDARALLQSRRASGAWLNAGFAVESLHQSGDHDERGHEPLARQRRAPGTVDA